MAAAVVALVVPAPPAHAIGPVFAGACPDLTLTVEYTNLDLVPGLPVTTVEIEGSADCLFDTPIPLPTMTLSGFGSTNNGAEIFTCAGGAVLGAGEVEVPHYVGFPHGQAEGPMIITVTAGIAHVTLLSFDGRVIGAGAFVQDKDDTADCFLDRVPPPPTPPPATTTTTWEGAFAFVVTTATP